MISFITHFKDFGENLSLSKHFLLAFVSTSVLSTIHLILGILIALINLAILVPLVVKTYKKKDKE